jgi:FKBP-type peptidyl-prolyl cis-trans isomerase 2
MNDDELEQIVDAIKLRRTYLSRQTTRELATGDSVEFEARGRTVKGTVIKINRKTVIVYEAGYGKWKVPASMLRKTETA